MAFMVSIGALAQVGAFTPPANHLGQSTWIPLRHQRQERNLCVPTSASIILDYFGDALSPREIKALAMNKRYVPGDEFNDFSITMFRDLIKGLATRGYQWRERDYSNDSAGLGNGIAEMERSLDAGIPVMIDTTAASAHTIVVAGYSAPSRVLYVVDPARSSPGIRAIGFEELDRIWNSTAVAFNGRAAVFPRRRTPD
jgi:hypothetical protein